MRNPETAPYVRDSDTSKEAAKAIEPHLSRMEANVFGFIKNAIDGATDDEIEVGLNLSHQTASARRRGLVLKGRIQDSGRRRITRTGCKAAVWIPVVA